MAQSPQAYGPVSVDLMYVLKEIKPKSRMQRSYRFLEPKQTFPSSCYPGLYCTVFLSQINTQPVSCSPEVFD